MAVPTMSYQSAHPAEKADPVLQSEAFSPLRAISLHSYSDAH